MQGFIEKLIGRLEEEKYTREEKFQYDTRMQEKMSSYNKGLNTAIRTVNQLAEEYKSIMNYNTLLNDIKSQLKRCIADSNNIDYNRALVEAIEVIDKKAEEHNGGWIPCSERLPEEEKEYLVCFETDLISISKYSLEDGFAKKYRTYIAEPLKPIAWQPLPAPYTEGE